MPLINFELRELSDINPYKVGLVWYYLSDSYYWLCLPGTTLYEFSNEYLSCDSNTGIKYNKYVNYELARLIEDFQSIFEFIAEEVPDEFYQLTTNANDFFNYYNHNQTKLDALFDTLSEEGYDDYYKLDEKANKWISERTLVAMHLNGSPTISFFRNKHNKINIVWDFDRAILINDNIIPIWSADKGCIELEYQDFVKEVVDFKNRVFDAMEIQIKKVTELKWKDYPNAKETRVKDHINRKNEFEKHLLFLQDLSSNTNNRNWDEIIEAVNKINN